MEQHRHNNYLEYAADLIEAIDSCKEDMRDEESIKNRLLIEEFNIYWYHEIKDMCKKRYRMYERGETETYLLSEQDILKAREDAVHKSVNDGLISLVEKGMVKVSLDQNGEFVYSRTEDGEDYIKNTGGNI